MHNLQILHYTSPQKKTGPFYHYGQIMLFFSLLVIDFPIFSTATMSPWSPWSPGHSPGAEGHVSWLLRPPRSRSRSAL